jgi:hypothetical protein
MTLDGVVIVKKDSPFSSLQKDVSINKTRQLIAEKVSLVYLSCSCCDS